MANLIPAVMASHCALNCSRHPFKRMSNRHFSIPFFQMTLAVGLLLILMVCPLTAQVDPNYGIQMWATSDFGIDLATSAISMQIPVRSKAGAIPFSAYLFGTNQAYESTVGGSQDIYVSQGLTYFDLTGLWVGSSANTTYNCIGHSGSTYTLYKTFLLQDLTGAVHLFPSNFTWKISSTTVCGTIPAPTTTTDGSGYTLVPLSQLGTFAVYDRSGNEMASYRSNGTLSFLNPIVTDPDGNSVTGLVDGAGSVTDSLGTTALTANISGGQTASYSYITESGSTAYFTYGYSTHNLKTNFACQYWGENENPGYQGQLLMSLTRPDGAQYQFAYEPTPNGNGFTNDGTYFTGRIAKITFPTGGSISYAYSGGNSGFDCTSGVVPTLTVTLNDNKGTVKTWTYTNSNYGSVNYQVTKTDPAGNQTIYYFSGEYRTQALAYQGGILQSSETTCYNGNFTNCASPSAAPTLPISQRDVYTSLNGGSSNLTETTYDSYGNTTEVKQYDFGAAMPPTGNPLSDTTITHAGVNGVTCGTAAPYQFDRPCLITTRKPSTSGTMVQVSQIQYTYTGGHATSTSTWVSGSSTLNASASYNSNGTVATSTNVDGNQTTYAYNGTDGCNGLLPTSITGGGLSQSIQWDCNGGVPTQTTDPNLQSTIYAYNDPFWRMTSMTDPLGNVTSYSYPTPNTFEAVMNFNGSTSTSDTLVTSDGLDRQIFKQTRQGPGLSTFDSVQTTYGWNSTGPYTTTTLPYSGTVAQAAPVGTGSITTKNDVNNRAISVTDSGGGVTSTTYAQNDVLSVLSPAPAGENNKQVQTQFDGLGRPTSVCAISGTVTGNVTCGQNTNTSATGVLTTTSYSTSTSGTQTVSSTRGVQTRSQTVDPLGRVTSSTSPESGTKTYIYDVATATCGSGIAVGALVETVDNAGVHTCLGIDVLYRVNHLALVSNGVWSNDRWFVYGDTPYTPPSGVTIQNGKGRVVEAYTGAKDVDEWFSYDKAGRLTDVWELTPHSGGYYHTTATYFANGAVQSVSGIPGVNGATYGIDGEGRPSTGSFGTTSIVNANGVVYNAASQQLTVPNMQGDTDVYQYDAMGRMKEYIFSVNGVSSTSTLGWNANSTLGNLGVVDNITPSETQTCNFDGSVAGYDDLGRLLNDNCSPVVTEFHLRSV